MIKYKIDVPSISKVLCLSISAILCSIHSANAQDRQSGVNPPYPHIALIANSTPDGAQIVVRSSSTYEERILVGSEKSYMTNIALSVPYEAASGLQLTIELLGDPMCCQISIYPSDGQTVTIDCNFSDESKNSARVIYGTTNVGKCQT